MPSADALAAHQAIELGECRENVECALSAGRVGWSAKALAQVLPIDPDTVRIYFKQYRGGGIAMFRQVLLRGGADWLTDKPLCTLNAHLHAHLQLSARDVCLL
jgi:hypothetical protein